MLRVRINHQSDDPIGFVKVWDECLSGKYARDIVEQLDQLKSNPMLQGEMLVLRLKTRDGGGCETQGSFLALEMKKTDEENQVADVYFYADKWRSW